MGRDIVVVVMRNIKLIIIKNEYHIKRLFVTKIFLSIYLLLQMKKGLFREISNRNG
jgi:hypothetical protein